jgi:8-oxoguanine deaminase
MAELLLSGCTTTTDHHYVFPPGLEHAIDIEAAVARRLGMRAVLARGSMNRSQRDGGLPPDGVVQDEDAILADSQRVIEAHHETGPGAMVQIALAPVSPFTVTPSLMKATAALAARLGVRLHTHFAETAGENDYCKAVYGHRALDHLDACGWLRGDVWVAHGIHVTSDEITRLARAGVAVTHCPCSNQVLGSGFCAVCDLEQAGVTVGLGVDGSGSSTSSNLMQEIRAAFLLQRGRYGVRRVTHRDAVRWATTGSAACIGRDDLGEIAVGTAADLALFKLDELRFAGHGDPIAALVIAGAHRADRVMVNGRWVVQDGTIAGIDLDRLIRTHQTMARAMQAMG